MDYNKRKDNNEDDIVVHARSLGLSVERLYYVGRGVPDLLVGGAMPCPHCGHLFWQELLIEVKQGQRQLRPNQERWWKGWGHEPRIAHNQQEFDRFVGRYGSAALRNRGDPAEGDAPG